jgi:hypothetical protein
MLKIARYWQRPSSALQVDHSVPSSLCPSGYRVAAIGAYIKSLAQHAVHGPADMGADDDIMERPLYSFQNERHQDRRGACAALMRIISHRCSLSIAQQTVYDVSTFLGADQCARPDRPLLDCWKVCTVCNSFE